MLTVAVSLADLKAYVGAEDTDDVALLSALEAATDLLDKFIGGSALPESIYDRCVLEVSHEHFKRKDSVSGSSQYAEYGTGQPVMGPRDPLTRVYPILRRYVLPF